MKLEWEEISEVIKDLERLKTCHHDISDIGNIIGIHFGDYLDDEGKEDFLSGVEHGKDLAQYTLKELNKDYPEGLKTKHLEK